MPGLDYFGARYYAFGLYRFNSVDPVVDMNTAIENPQRWNRYAYCLNNPVTQLDKDGREPGKPYKTRDEAAKHALQDIFKKSIDENWEYAGRIYRNRGGSFSYTKPSRIKVRIYSNPGPWPTNTQNEGYYHTHGDKKPGWPGEEFSPEDLRLADTEQKPGYLATPSGIVKRYSPSGQPGKTAEVKDIGYVFYYDPPIPMNFPGQFDSPDK